MKTIHKINTLLIFMLVMTMLLSMAPRPKGQANSGDTAIIIDDGKTLRLGRHINFTPIEDDTTWVTGFIGWRYVKNEQGDSVWEKFTEIIIE